MGRDIETTVFTREDRSRFREKVTAGLEVLRALVDRGAFETGRRTCGAEVEVAITGADGDAAARNAELLALLEPVGFESELARFTIEFGVHPQPVTGPVLRTLEADLCRAMDHAHRAAADLGAGVTIIGILPTLRPRDFVEENMSPNRRYRALNDMILASRGEDVVVDIAGAEHLRARADTILFEAACTSMQLHLQVDPHDFGPYWNAAQLLSAPLVAVAANSPFFLGRHLHAESRIAVFEQAIETRTPELARQGVRPRVWFGEKWLDDGEGLWDLFEENVRYFPALLPICDGEDPAALLAAGQIPPLPELTLHNGTIYRWNRPVYEVVGGRPHMRIENRVLPAGPSVADSVANAAFFYGLLHGLVSQPRPHPWEQVDFPAVSANFYAAAHRGLEARLCWPSVGSDVPVRELILRHLLPLARAGLAAWQVDEGDAEHFLGIVADRCRAGRNGAAWQVETWQSLVRSGVRRDRALRDLVRIYSEHSAAGTPVHTWPV